MQSTCDQSNGLHVGIILDGNGRFAARRGRPRSEGHAAGAAAVRRIVEAAPRFGIRTLTLFAFASANWQRPPAEVAALMRLLHVYLFNETENCARQGVRVSFIGRRDRLSPSLRTTIAAVEQLTGSGTTLHLRMAIDYSSRAAIFDAALRMAAQRVPHDLILDERTCHGFTRLLAADLPDAPTVPDVDLVIRTGGERRLSDFLLWESAFAELHFTDRMWPEFSVEDLAAAIDDFHSRERRFGRVEPPEASRPAVFHGFG